MYALLKEEIYDNKEIKIQQEDGFANVIKFFGHELPNEIHLEIFKYLNSQDLNTCLLVNRQYKAFIDNNFKLLYQSDDLEIKNLYTLLSFGIRQWDAITKDIVPLHRDMYNKIDKLKSVNDSLTTNSYYDVHSYYEYIVNLFCVCIDVSHELIEQTTLPFEIKQLENKIAELDRILGTHEEQIQLIKRTAFKIFISKLGNDFSMMKNFPYSRDFFWTGSISIISEKQ